MLPVWLFLLSEDKSMNDKHEKACKIVEIFDDFLDDRLSNRGIELNCSMPFATEEAKNKEPRMFNADCMIYGYEWSQMVEEIERIL